MTDKRFIEQFEENVQKYPDKVILRDEHSSLTFRELDELSGRVYAYLKEKGIGREDFVMIDLPRSVEQYAAMIGIWKAGAVQVCVEEDFPDERKQFIYKDCNCKLTLNKTIWYKVYNHLCLDGYEMTLETDAALALYTSGSDGMPKGTLHEYGKLTQMSHSVLENGKLMFRTDDRFGLILPMCHIAGLLLINSAIYVGCYVDIVPYDIMFEAAKLEAHINEEQLTITGTIPSIAKYNYNTPSLRYFMTGAEMSSNIYSENYAFLNIYGQTEVAMATFTFVIDKPYEVTPIGLPSGVKNVQIIDGELCYEHTFSRGYINQNSLTKEKFFDGLYHTGDIARINEDGNYVILGRKSDMIKINGNRIEPAEIEAAVKKVLGIDWAFAKGFVEPERSYIVVYYTADLNLSSPSGEGTGVRLYAHIREELMKILPTYMIPSYFVHLDEIPHLPNGKVDRQALKAPDIEQYRAPYVAPENELEARLCQEMEQILFVNKSLALSDSVLGKGCPEGEIGALDDFFLLGGDSLRTIELVTNLAIENLTVTDIYAARTPRAIAERWMRKMMM